MGTPEFLCIGAPKSGSTWLHELLSDHPQIFFPEEVKEIHFFDRYVERGVDWYLNLFANSRDDQIAGDVTPHYLYLDNPSTIKAVPSISKLILIYRDPVDRCVSHYHFRRRLDNYQKSFEEFLEDYPTATKFSMYGEHLANFFEHFPPEQFLILRFEEAVKSVGRTKKVLSEFLGIDSTLFPNDAGTKKVNSKFTPRNARLYKAATRISRLLVDMGLYKFRNRIKSLVVNRLKKPANDAKEPEINQATKEMLRELFEADQKLFAELIQKWDRFCSQFLQKTDLAR